MASSLANFPLPKSVIFVALFFGCCLYISFAVQYNVGDSSGWSFSSDNYTRWLAGKTFRVNDTLFFAYRRGAHDVVEVYKSDYDSCTAPSDPAFDDHEAGNTTVKLIRSGTYYYICTLPQHCASGNMKIAVQVVVEAGSTTSGSAGENESSSSSTGGSSGVVEAGLAKAVAIAVLVAFISVL